MLQRLFNSLRSINWGRVFGYMALFFVLFITFLYLKFPGEAIKNAYLASIHSKYDIRVNVNKLSPYRLTGMKVSNVVVTKKDDPTDVLMKIEKGKVRVHVLPLLTGKVKADFDLYTFGGGLAGQLEYRKPEFAIATNFKNLDIAKVGAGKRLKNIGNVEISGTMDGSTELYFNFLERNKNTGKVRLEYKRLAIANSTILENKVPDIIFNEPTVIQLSMNNRFLKIDEWNLSSNALEVQASGQITLMPRYENSRLNIKMGVKPSEELEDSFGTYLGIAAMNPKFPDQDDKGFYNFTINGTVKKPGFKKR